MHGDGDTISMQIRSPKAMKKDTGIDNNELQSIIKEKYATPKDKVVESSIFQESSSKVKFDNLNTESKNMAYKSMEQFLN